jgi:hypothetical protein
MNADPLKEVAMMAIQNPFSHSEKWGFVFRMNPDKRQHVIC